MGGEKEAKMSKEGTKAVKVTAQGLLALLEVKHGSDLFVPECKDGPSWGSRGGLRMDALAMNRSWANACVWGYEIKVSRSDFLKDDKWPGYLASCNRFSFVCPSGLIKVEEVGDQAGLLWASRTGTRLYTKKKAPFRESEPGALEVLFRYILICRATIGDERFRERGGDAEYWRWWIAQKKQNAEMGYRVGKRIQEVIKRDIEAVGRENGRLTSEAEQYEGLKAEIEKLGLSGGFGLAYAVRERIAQAEGIPYRVIQAASQARDAADRSLKMIEGLAQKRKAKE